jgi:hypothetical protein
MVGIDSQVDAVGLASSFLPSVANMLDRCVEAAHLVDSSRSPGQACMENLAGNCCRLCMAFLSVAATA